VIAPQSVERGITDVAVVGIRFRTTAWLTCRESTMIAFRGRGAEPDHFFVHRHDPGPVCFHCLPSPQTGSSDAIRTLCDYGREATVGPVNCTELPTWPLLDTTARRVSLRPPAGPHPSPALDRHTPAGSHAAGPPLG
jgi:hypothetical protein